MLKLERWPPAKGKSVIDLDNDSKNAATISLSSSVAILDRAANWRSLVKIGDALTASSIRTERLALSANNAASSDSRLDSADSSIITSWVISSYSTTDGLRLFKIPNSLADWPASNPADSNMLSNSASSSLTPTLSNNCCILSLSI